MIRIEKLAVSDVTQRYVDWYNDEIVTQFSDNQYRNFSLEGQKAYVAACIENPDIELYGIFDRKIHIGNTVLSGLCGVHKKAEVTYIIGEKNYWGKGVGTIAVSEMVRIGKSKRLHKLYAGIAEGNIGSQRVLEKNGFVVEGIRKEHLFYNGKFYNQIDFGLIIE